MFSDCVIEVPQRLGLWESTEYTSNLRGYACLFWANVINIASHNHQMMAGGYCLKLAREGIKCLIDCYHDPPDCPSVTKVHYLSYAVREIVSWGKQTIIKIL